MCGAPRVLREHVWPGWLEGVCPGGIPERSASAHLNLVTGVADDLRQWQSKHPLDEKVKVVRRSATPAG